MTIRTAPLPFPPRLALALALLAATSPARADDVETLRQAMLATAQAGCVEAIVQPAVRQYMAKAAAAGHPIASEQAARTEFESKPQWTSQMLPAIRGMCDCAMARMLAPVRAATTMPALEAAAQDMQASGLADLGAHPEVMQQCMDQHMAPVMSKLGAASAPARAAAPATAPASR